MAKKLKCPKDYEGKQLKIGDAVSTKWGGMGKIVKYKNKCMVAFEDGNYITDLTKESINYRNLAKTSKKSL